MIGADLVRRGEHRREPYVVAGGGGAAVHGRRARPRHQAQRPAAPGRARASTTHVLPGDRDRRRPAGRRRRTRCSSRNGPGDPATADYAVEAGAGGARRPPVRCSASASATRSSAGRWASAPTSCGFGHRGHQPAGARPGHRQGRGDQPQPRLRRRRAARPADRHPVRRRSRSATSASTTTSSRGCAASTCRRSPCSTTRRRRPARTTRTTCSTGSSSSDGGAPRCLSGPTSAARAGDRLRADRHRPGLRVRLLRHPGLPGAARPRGCGSAWSTPTRRRS